MSFTSGAFIFFFALFALLWPVLRQRAKARYAFISLASFVFYGWWDWRFVGLLVGTGAVDFIAAWFMEARPRWRGVLLWGSIVSNIGVLCFFKYLGFGLDQIALLFDVPLPARQWAHDLILPVGISFYTFASLSYTIDVYRGEIRAVRDPLHFYAFLSMFPHLVAGPIVRAADLLPQLETPGHFCRANRWQGLRRVAWGYMKKCIVADHLAPVVNEAFASTPLLGLGWWVVVGLFAIQIFCDFSGYCDIACGLARWMGYRFPENFVQPYAAIGFRDFWSRWHVSLSTWFRDYLYVPLGGSRRTGWRTNLNLVLTMLVSGLWHGANLTYVVWGFFHAILLVLERLFRWVEDRMEGPSLPSRKRTLVGWIITLACVCIGWALFRAQNLPQAMCIISAMLGLKGLGYLPAAVMMPSVMLALFVIGIGACHWALRPFLRRVVSFRLPEWIECIGVAAALLLATFLRGPGGDFIYFQF